MCPLGWVLWGFGESRRDLAWVPSSPVWQSLVQHLSLPWEPPDLLGGFIPSTGTSLLRAGMCVGFPVSGVLQTQKPSTACSGRGRLLACLSPCQCVALPVAPALKPAVLPWRPASCLQEPPRASGACGCRLALCRLCLIVWSSVLTEVGGALFRPCVHV